jgi:predicted phage terminase large subunit-like protein
MSHQIYLSSTRASLKKQLFLNTVLLNPYIPHKPTSKQALFLLLDNKEALYGGAAGGGKSDALLMAALQYVNVPRYSAIIFRRSYADLCKAGALIDRSHEWLGATNAQWDGQNHTWNFPSTAKLSFGYLENDRDVYHHQSAEYQFEGFDELTQFNEFQYRYMSSRLRRLTTSHVPLRQWSASNPGNTGHDWVKQWFMTEGYEHGRVFIPSKLQENPYLDQKSYIESLMNLDPITRRQYLDGDWTAKHGGSIFQREWFTIVDAYPQDCKLARYWDKAATKPKSTNRDPDYTVGVKLAENRGIYYIVDVKRVRGNPAETEALIKQTAELDLHTKTYMEQEPGSSGVEAIDHYNREVLKGFAFYGVKTTGPKAERAAPVASAAEAGNIKLVRGTWNNAFLDELEGFPIGEHDDQVDALSGAFSQLGHHDSNAWKFG